MLTSKFQSIPKLVEALKNNEVDTLDYFDNLEIIHQQVEPQIKAFLPEESRFSRIKNQVERLKIKYPQSKLPRLFCLPIGVKDIFHVNGFQTHAGSQLPINELTGEEAKSVSVLKELGTLILGKTVTTEFAYFAPGPTRNPHNHNHTPGGSSSGSAAAVASGLVPFAFGTQTIGSVIRPASYCGVVGYKPTYNRISKDGVIPLSPSVDTVGYFTSDILSAGYMANILCSGWRLIQPSNTKPVLGIPIGPYLNEASSGMLEHINHVSDFLSNLGYQIKKVKAMEDFEEIFERHNLIVAYEAAKIHEKWFQKYQNLYHPKTIELILKGRNTKARDYKIALEGRQKLRNEIMVLAEINGIDLWISPPAQGSAPIGLDSTGDPVMNLPWTHCGFPTVNIPAGQDENGLPMGLQVTAGWNEDESLLFWCTDIEKQLQ